MAKPAYFIIQEVYNQSGDEEFEAELDHALDVEAETIIIEPVQFGLETAHWISIGNFLHKSAVLTGLATLAMAAYSDKLYLVLPLGCSSFICASVYMASWQPDPCCKYQVESDSTKMDRLPLHKLSSTSPIVLVRKDDTRRKVLHNSLALLSLSVCCWKIYQSYS